VGAGSAASPTKKKQKSLLEDKNEIVQIACFKKQSAIEALTALRKELEQKEQIQAPVEKKFTSPLNSANQKSLPI